MSEAIEKAPGKVLYDTVNLTTLLKILHYKKLFVSDKKTATTTLIVGIMLVVVF